MKLSDENIREKNFHDNLHKGEGKRFENRFYKALGNMFTDFDQEELQMFLEKCTEAISVNAAEQERFQSEYNELAMKDAGLERYFENAEGLDIPSAMAAYRLSRVQMDIKANLMGAVKEMENVLYTDFLE